MSRGDFRLAQRENDVCQLEAFRSPGELDEVISRDVLGDDGARGADQVRETDRVVDTARTNVADRHAWLQFKKTGDLTGLVQGVAVFLAGAAWADDRRNQTPG
jgi:hypothetical protein